MIKNATFSSNLTRSFTLNTLLCK